MTKFTIEIDISKTTKTLDELQLLFEQFVKDNPEFGIQEVNVRPITLKDEPCSDADFFHLHPRAE